MCFLISPQTRWTLLRRNLWEDARFYSCSCSKGWRLADAIIEKMKFNSTRLPLINWKLVRGVSHTNEAALYLFGSAEKS